MITGRRGTCRVLLAVVLACLALCSAATASDKVVALTFDDGPSPYTRPLLKKLEQKRVDATFFVLGEHLSSYGGALRTMQRRGHEIGNHTWSHPFLTSLPTSRIRHELGRTSRAIYRIVKPLRGDRPRMFRPPYGAVNRSVRQIARESGLRTVLWDVNPADYYTPGTDAIVRRVVQGVDRRSVVLMHDGGGPRAQTVRAVPRIVRKLRRRGYEFVTVSEFFRSGGYSSSAVAAKGSTGVSGFEQEPVDAFGIDAGLPPD